MTFKGRAKSLMTPSSTRADRGARLLSKPAPQLEVQDRKGSTTLKPFSAMPGPQPWPLVGCIPEVYPIRHTFHQYLDECFRKYGDIFKLKLFGKACIVYNLACSMCSMCCS